MITWLTTTTFGWLLSTFFISMIPVMELRGGLPYGITLGLPYSQALLAAILGNMLPVPLIIVYIRRVFAWIRKLDSRWEGLVTKMERKAHLRGRMVHKYSTVGLCLLVAIPIPGTGAWTGALVAAVLDIRLCRAIPAIFLGVCIAAAIMTAVTFGVIHYV